MQRIPSTSQSETANTSEIDIEKVVNDYLETVDHSNIKPFKWYSSKDILPPNTNDYIMTVDERSDHPNVEIAFVRLQNALYVRIAHNIRRAFDWLLIPHKRGDNELVSEKADPEILPKSQEHRSKFHQRLKRLNRGN